jgi:bifunctional non-homologous end joining protein LigD
MTTLQEYKAKRNFKKTPEPGPGHAMPHRRPIFVVQEHHASRLHYDFRLEADGVLKSWAVPKEPSMDPSQKRLAVHVEDHPVAYADFKGTIPEGEYGAGEVFIWDRGTYKNLLSEKANPQTVAEGIDSGRVEVCLHGKRLEGNFALIKMRGRGKDNWLLIKMKDEFARPDHAPTKSEPRKANKTRSKPRSLTNRAGRTGVSSKSKNSAEKVTLSHGDKVLFPETGITKEEVFDYYRRIAPRLLPFLRDRPVTLERCPEGIGPDAPHFLQKHTPAYYPSWIPRVELPTELGRPVAYALVNDEPTLLYLVNQGTLTFHVWFSRTADLDRPDFVLFDLDPGSATFADTIEVALELRKVLEEEEVEPYVKTSGNTGLHVVTRWEDEGGYGEARFWAQNIAARLADEHPKLATIDIRKAKRGRRVYIDTLQNARGHHAVAPYVIRAVPGAPISTPLGWREVKPGLDPADFNIRTIFQRLGRQRLDPMAGLLQNKAKDYAGAGSS